MILRRQLLSLAAIVLAGLMFLQGCSSASAPPLSIPAPVTGRITVTSPDEDGVALVVGDESAVTAGSVVHVTNETQASTTSLLLWNIFPEALAQASLPTICSRPFHACAVAEDDGSFEIDISASDDDEISVETLDATSGAATSEKIRKPVPNNIQLFVLPIADIDLLPAQNKLYVLMKDLTDTSRQGLVSIFDVETNARNPIAFVGTDPHRMAIHTGTNQAAVLDKAGRFVAIVDLASNNFDDPATVEAIPSPQDVVFNTAGTSLLVSSGQNSVRMLTQIDVASRSITGQIGPDELLSQNITHDNTLALDVLRDTANGRDLVAAISAFTSGSPQPGSQIRTAVSLLDFDTLQNLSGFVELPAGTAPDDVAFVPGENRLLITESGNDSILVYNYTIGLTQVQLTLVGEISDPQDIIVKPRDIAFDPIDRLAFVNARNGNEERPDTVITVDLQTLAVIDANPVGINPSALVWDSDRSQLYVATRKTRAVTLWDLPTLMP